MHCMQTQSFHSFQKQLGSQLKKIRKACGLSQEAVGELVGMDRVSIGYIEQGKRAPKLRTLHVLAQTYHVEMRDFFDFPQANNDIGETSSDD